MSLALDDRQRAMLLEMGVRVFDAGRLARSDAADAVSPRAARAVRTAGASGASAAPSPVPMPAPPVLRSLPTPVREPGGPGSGLEHLDWDALQLAAQNCRACRLCEGRSKVVFGAGDRQADWLVVGDPPGEPEDLQGEPFVGPAGQLLDNMLAALALRRGQRVYLANVVRCRPPADRSPAADEAARCEPYLRRQIELLQPRIILVMGRFAAQSMLQTAEPFGKLRGRVHSYQGVPLVVTYHPAYLLRNLPDKAKAWADLCLAQSVVRQAAS